jgi:hypothetical protein
VGVRETRIIKWIYITYFGGTKRAQYTWEVQGFKRKISVKAITVNNGNLGVSCSGLFENRLQQKGFQNFHSLLMKSRYFQFFVIVIFSLSFGGTGNK